MVSQTSALKHKHCKSCEGDVPRLSPAETDKLHTSVPDWRVLPDGKHLRREWQVKDFASGMEFCRKVADLAEEEGHHPDLHLVNYRDLAIELSTHAVGGLTENDFILAAKIDDLPVALKKDGSKK